MRKDTNHDPIFDALFAVGAGATLPSALGLLTGRRHVDDLQVREGYAFAVEPIRAIALGGDRRQRDAETADALDAFPYFPAGRGA